MRRSVFDRPAQWIQRAGVVALFMILVLSAFTGSADGKVFGYGNKVCLEYVEVFDNQDVRSLYASWAQGYFSSISHREGMSDFTRGIGEDPNAMQKGYIPESEDIFAHSKLIQPNQAEVMEFTAPAAGTYDYLCTFPGHWILMKGVMTVE